MKAIGCTVKISNPYLQLLVIFQFRWFFAWSLGDFSTKWVHPPLNWLTSCWFAHAQLLTCNPCVTWNLCWSCRYVKSKYHHQSWCAVFEYWTKQCWSEKNLSLNSSLSTLWNCGEYGICIDIHSLYTGQDTVVVSHSGSTLPRHPPLLDCTSPSFAASASKPNRIIKPKLHKIPWEMCCKFK